MLIEYKVKFEKDGLTITQQVKQDSSRVQAKPAAPVKQNALGASLQESQTPGIASRQAGGGPDEQDPGGGPDEQDPGGTPATGGGPMTIIGPFIFLCPCHGSTNTDPKTNHG